MIGQNHQSALATPVDRVSKFTLIKKVDSKHVEVVTAATITLCNSKVLLVLVSLYLCKVLRLDSWQSHITDQLPKLHLQTDSKLL